MAVVIARRKKKTRTIFLLLICAEMPTQPDDKVGQQGLPVGKDHPAMEKRRHKKRWYHVFSRPTYI